MRRKPIVAAFAVVVAVAGAAPFVGGQDKRRAEILRVDLTSIFQAHNGVTARLVRGMLVMPDGDVKSQDFRIPLDLPVGATVTEVGLVGQTSNRLAVKIERLDHTNVYEGKATNLAEPAGSWGCIEVVDRNMSRRIEKPVPDDEKNPAPPRREKFEHELLVAVTIQRDPNLSIDTRRAAPQNQRDRVEALWIKFERQ